MARLFIAIPIPENIQEQLQSLQYEGWEEGNVIPKDFHITLQFLGEIPDHQIPNLIRSLERIVFANFRLQIRGVDFFGKNDRPHIYFAKVFSADEGFDELFDLHGLIQDELNMGPFKSAANDHKKFKPHITLTRLKNIYDSVEQLPRLLQLGGDFVSEEFEVNYFALYESRPFKANNRYQLIEKFF